MCSRARSLDHSLWQAGLRFPMHPYGITQIRFLDHEQLGTVLRNLREGAGALMRHPGCADPDPQLTRVRSKRLCELDALTRP